MDAQRKCHRRTDCVSTGFPAKALAIEETELRNLRVKLRFEFRGTWKHFEHGGARL